MINGPKKMMHKSKSGSACLEEGYYKFSGNSRPEAQILSIGFTQIETRGRAYSFLENIGKQLRTNHALEKGPVIFPDFANHIKKHSYNNQHGIDIHGAAHIETFVNWARQHDEKLRLKLQRAHAPGAEQPWVNKEKPPGFTARVGRRTSQAVPYKEPISATVAEQPVSQYTTPGTISSQLLVEPPRLSRITASQEALNGTDDYLSGHQKGR